MTGRVRLAGPNQGHWVNHFFLSTGRIRLARSNHGCWARSRRIEIVQSGSVPEVGSSDQLHEVERGHRRCFGTFYALSKSQFCSFNANQHFQIHRRSQGSRLLVSVSSSMSAINEWMNECDEWMNQWMNELIHRESWEAAWFGISYHLISVNLAL